ncbi:MAG TPA: type II toxin-antitoxin system RelE/ParE family toxin [Silvibacterium sp.]|nr:type II toxin-antitoxin system RelE/ParE family toxin [Silvibacterium sp.]
MAWRIEFSVGADKTLGKLDVQIGRRIRKFLDRVASQENPRSIGDALQGSKLGELWRYRVGDYRLICSLEDDQLIVLVLRIGHRREVYKRA